MEEPTEEQRHEMLTKMNLDMARTTMLLSFLQGHNTAQTYMNVKITQMWAKEILAYIDDKVPAEVKKACDDLLSKASVMKMVL